MKRFLSIFYMLCLCTVICSSAEAFSINVADGSIREVLRSAARVGAINLILDDSVQGNVTVNLQKVSPEEAIKSIALAKGLSVLQDNGTTIVTKLSSKDFNPAKIYVFPLKYGNPDDIRSAVSLMSSESIKDKKNDNTREGMRIWTDSGTNSLLLYGNQRQADLVAGLLEKIDVPAQQVSLEAKIVSIEKSAVNKFGISYDWSKVEFTNLNDFEASATVDALVKDGRAEILSRPNILTMQGREAVINIGGEIPVPTTSVTNSTMTNSFEYKQTGIILKYTPYVNDNSYVTAKVHTEISTPTYVEEMGAYKFENRSADTMVRLKDGETMVIGGLIGKNEYELLAKIPLLSDIPILGKLFTSKNKSKTENEIVIFLTATLVK